MVPKSNLKKIKQLREETKAGVMECRQVLIATGGDLTKARILLKQKGAKVAKDKANRVTNSGIISSYVHNDARVAALVKLHCESDFVAHNEEFTYLAHELAMQVAAMDPGSVKHLLEQEYIRDPKVKIADVINETIGKLKENIKITEICRLEI